MASKSCLGIALHFTLTWQQFTSLRSRNQTQCLPMMRRMGVPHTVSWCGEAVESEWLSSNPVSATGQTWKYLLMREVYGVTISDID